MLYLCLHFNNPKPPLYSNYLSMKKYLLLVIIYFVIVSVLSPVAYAQTYCTPTYSSACSSNDYINNFSFNTLVRNNSGCNGNPNNYIHDLSTTTSVEQGESYSISMQAGQEYNQGFGVWIDYNQDGDFADADEFVYASPSAGIQVFSGYVTISPSALTGVTRLRVRCNYSATVSAVDSCSNFSYGETEDYNITITQAPPCNNPPTAGTAVSTKSLVCDTLTQFSLTLSGNVNGAGQTYQWQKSPNGSNWNNISGATSKSYTDTIKQTTHFRCVVTCVGSSISTPVVVTLSPAFGNLGFSVTDVSCSGLSDGEITATLSGGATPYTYQWLASGTALGIAHPGDAQRTKNTFVTKLGDTDPEILTGDTFPNSATISNLYASQYNLTVTGANGCSVTGSANVNQPSPIYLTANTANASCTVSDGAASVTVSGGTGTYTYLWQGGQTNDTITAIPSGIYTVTVTDSNGCSNLISMGVSDNSAPMLTFTLTPSTCHGDDDATAFVEATGGSPFSYLWNTSPQQTTDLATGLSPKKHLITVTDASDCKTIQEITSTQPDSLEVNPYVNTNVSCPGNTDGSLGVSVYGGTAGYSYQWSSGSTDSGVYTLGMGTYTITVTDANNCVNSNTVALTSPASINVSISKSDILCNSMCNGTAAATVTGGTSPYTFLWMPGNYTTQSITGLCANNYTLTVSDSYSCGVTVTQTFAITQPTALVNSIGTPVNVSCYGGNNGSATANPTGGTTSYSYLWTPTSQTTKTASNLIAGTYTVKVTDANGCTKTTTVSLTQPAAALTATIVSTNLSCNAQCIGSATVTPSGGTTPYTYNWISASQSTSIATGLCAIGYTASVTDVNGCAVSKTVTLTQPAALTASTTASNATCFNSNDGAVSSTPGGGTIPYTYLWMPGNITTQSASALAANTYTLTTTDSKGCTITKTAVITEPAALSLTVTSSDASCNAVCSGSASVSVTGGTTPYTYLWNPSGIVSQNATGLCAGTHIVEVTDNNNCFFADTIIIQEPLAIPVTVTVTPTSCGTNSGAAVASVSGPGAIPPFTYLWTNGSTNTSINGLDAGIYRANVTDGNGCFGFADAFVTSSNGPVVTTNTVVPVSCNGFSDGAIDISVTGGTLPYTFEWTNGQTTEDAFALAHGPYEVKVTDAASCLVVKSIFINEPAKITLTTSTISSGCNATNGSATVTVSGGTTPYAYLWSSGGTASNKTGLGAGIYKVIVTDYNGCMDSSIIAVQDSGGPVVLVDTIAGVNCGGSGFVLLSPLDSASIQSFLWNTGSTTQNLNNVSPGNYGVVVSDTSGCKSVLVTAVNPVLPPIKPICLVTVDTLTGKNIVVWEKPISSFIAGFNIYRETSKQGIFQKVAYSPYIMESTYYDSIADPDAKWTRYRISMVDVCGTEGPVSPDHKTIHLSIQSTNTDSTFLIWDNYIGYPFTQYDIYRKDSPGGIWNLIGSVPASVKTYIDNTFPHTGDTVSYHVDVEHPGGDCIATIKYPEPMATTVKSGKSNSSERATDLATSSPEISPENNVLVYPSPNNGLFTVELKNISFSEIRIFNVLGEEVKKINTANTRNKIEVDIQKQPAGLYYVQVSSAQTVITKKIVLK